MNKSKILYVFHTDFSILSHRKDVIKTAVEEGFEVIVIATSTGYKKEVEQLGIEKYIDFPYPINNNPINAIKSILWLARKYKHIKPDLIHHISIYMTMIGVFASKLSRQKKVVSSISGLGSGINNLHGLKKYFYKIVFGIIFKNKYFHYIVQNTSNLDFCLSQGIEKQKIHLIKGSGVDLNIFRYTEPIKKQKLQLLFSGRIIRDKGVCEFIAAAQKLKSKYEDTIEFLIAGFFDKKSPTSMTKDELQELIQEPYIRYIGYIDNINSLLQQVDIVVLPSYGEGMSKSLIDACAVGRPIITTDICGCKECVENNNGFVVPIKNVELLAEKIEILINDSVLRRGMGIKGRELAEREFSIENVIKRHLEIYLSILENKYRYRRLERTT